MRPIARASVAVAGLANLALLVAAVRFAETQTWAGTGGNPQHTNLSAIASKPLGHVLWSTPIDLFQQSAGSAHYAGPIITAKNTVVTPVKTGETDGFRVEGHAGTTGKLLYTVPTDFSLAVTTATSWTGVFPIGIAGTRLVLAGAGGTVYIKSNIDQATSPVAQQCFYTKLATYQADPANYAMVKISTPITGTATEFYFGYQVFGGASAALSATLGTGGIVVMDTAGRAKFAKVSALIPANSGDLCRPMYNAAPVVSNDGLSIYVGVVNQTQGRNYLVKLNATTLAETASVRLLDPKNRLDVFICTCSSASPMVAPDGHVYFGVLRNNDTTSHGWMLQFDQNLDQYDSKGTRYPVGAFGWDDTASVVPASLVASYKGTASYLLLTKYNNYVETGGNGKNQLAIVDPTSDSRGRDIVTKFPVMNPVITIDGITCDSDFYACTPTTNVNLPTVPVREWCINSAAIDPVTKSALVNSEDGHAYRWNFTTNTLTQATYLQPATGEPYTPTAIGPDGTVYVINNAVLAAIAPAAP